MPQFTMKDLVKAGLHFGHAAASWNPKMAPYLLGVRKKVHIFDLRHTARSLVAAQQLVRRYAAEGRRIIFVGTKLQAQDQIKEVAQATSSFYVNERWLGGMLSNHDMVRRRVRRLVELEGIEAQDHSDYSKKVLATFRRELKKLRRDLDGVRQMDALPDLMVVVDPKLEHNAVHEANICRIPVVALTDSNSNPESIDLVIPGNDDAQRAIRLVFGLLRDAILEGQKDYQANHGASAVEGEAKVGLVDQQAGEGATAHTEA